MFHALSAASEQAHMQYNIHSLYIKIRMIYHFWKLMQAAIKYCFTVATHPLPASK